MHAHNRRTSALLLAFVIVALLVSVLAAARGDARRSAGFEPTAETLDCINLAEHAPDYDHDGRTYDGRYEADRAFALAYSAMIPAEHWRLWGSDRSAPTHTWHPMIQDEMARNGVRRRGLAPWPPATRRCARLATAPRL